MGGVAGLCTVYEKPLFGDFVALYDNDMEM